MGRWRLLRLGIHNASMNMAIDEAVFRARGRNLVPSTIRFYLWNPSAVSIGRFQRIEEEVWVDNCRKFGVDVVRRISGGGTVYHDSRDEITYSVVATKEDLEAHDVAMIYSKICNGLVKAAGLLGLRPDLSEGNLDACPNLTVDGKKLSGNAQCHKGGVVLQHGTLLLDVNLERMFTFLRVPWLKTPTEAIAVAKRKITSLKNELESETSIEHIERALVTGFQEALDIELVEDRLATPELKSAKKLSEEKYDTHDWNFHGRNG